MWSSSVPPPAELILRRFARLGVRLAWNVPAAVDRAIVEAVLLVRRRHTAQRCLAWELEHGDLGLHIKRATGLEHEHLHPFHRQCVSGLSAARAGADDDDIVGVSEFFCGNEGHGFGVLRMRPRGLKPNGFAAFMVDSTHFEGS